MACEVQILAILQRLFPPKLAWRCFLLPHQARAFVSDGAIAVVDEAPLHWATDMVVAVLPWPVRIVAGDFVSRVVVAGFLSSREQPRARSNDPCLALKEQRLELFDAA